MTTLAAFINAFETELFSPGTEDKFISHCAAREKSLKSFLNVCWKEINNHIELPFLSEEDVKVSWRKLKIEQNQKALLQYLDYLVSELDKNKIEKFISEKIKEGGRFLPFEPDALLLTFCSYYGTIVSDLFWIGNITVADVVYISKRQLDLASLGKYVSEHLTSIELLLNEKSSIFNKHQIPMDTIREALVSQKRNLYKGFNLIVITAIEGIVRSFGEWLIAKQSLTVKKKSHSLDSFLKDTSWKPDLPILVSKYYQMTGDYNFEDSKAFSVTNYPKRLPKTVDFKTRLAFLNRGFKERRNALAHGENVDYEDTVQALINAAALREVLQTVIEYEDVYPT